MLLENIMSTLYDLRNMSKVQYNITKIITRIATMETLFYLSKQKSKMNNKTFKHYKSKNDSRHNKRHSL